MPLVVKDRVKETTTTAGTGTITLAGAVSGFQSFSVIGNGNTTYYAIVGGTQWEVGIGTYTASGTTLSRDTVLESSTGGTKVDFAAGTKDVFCTYPAEQSVDLDTAQTLTNKTFDGGTIVTANSSANALRITQTGAGVALIVEDSTTPDSTPFVVDANGTVLVGATNTYSSSGIATPSINISSTSAGVGIGIASWVGASAGAGNFQFMKSRGSTIGSYTVVADGDSLGIIRFSGADGANFISAATIIGAVDGTPGTNDMPGRLVFSTTADGASSPTERMRIGNNGTITLGASLGSESLRVSPVTSSVNYVQVTGGATGGAVSITSQGSDANVQMNILAKGTGAVVIGNNTRAAAQFTTSGLTTVNYFQVAAAVTGSGPVLSSVGTDTNIDLTLTPKGTGKVVITNGIQGGTF